MDNKDVIILKQILRKGIEDFEAKTNLCIEEIQLIRSEVIETSTPQLKGVRIKLSI